MDTNAMLQVFSELENAYKLPKNYLAGAAGIESNFGRAGDRPGSQYQGMFQLGEPIRRQYGVTNPNDWQQSAMGAARYAQHNMDIFRNKFGRDPSGSELYIMHQQGEGGGPKLIGNPNAPAGMLTNPNFIRANGGDPSAPAGAFLKQFDDKFNQKVSAFAGVPNAGQMGDPAPGQAVPNSNWRNTNMAGMGDPLAFANTSPQDRGDAINAMQKVFGRSAPTPNDASMGPGGGLLNGFFPKPSSETWDNLGKVGNGLTRAGAAIMAISNPSGAAALAKLADAGDTNGASDWMTTVHNGQVIRVNKKTGESSATPVPNYQKEQPDEPSEVRLIKFMQEHPEYSETYKQLHPDKEEPSYDPEALKTFGTDYLVNGNQAALKDIPIKQRPEALRLAKEQYKKDTGTDYDPTDLGVRRGAYLELQAENRKFGQMLPPTQSAHDRLQADIQIAKERVADIPAELNAHNLPWNKFMQMTSQQLQDAGFGKLAKAREAIYNVERGYSAVQANGMRSGDTVTSQKRAEALINSAMTPDVLLGEVGKDGKRSGGLLDFMGESSGRILASVKNGQQRLREEWKKGATSFAGRDKEDAAREDAEIEKRLGARPAEQAPAPTEAPKAPNQDQRQKALDELRRRGLIK